MLEFTDHEHMQLPCDNMPFLTAPLAPETSSVCPDCLRVIPAKIVQNKDEAFLHKQCLAHGETRTVIWRGHPGLESWRRSKQPVFPRTPMGENGRGCPWDCGLCAEHRQRSCTVLVEITQHCDLRCPVCFADAGQPVAPAPSMSALFERMSRAFEQSGPVPVQLSGGEPTAREDLPELVRMMRMIGFSHVQLNTNGLRLGREPGFAVRLREAGLSWVFLQFDGVDDEIHARIRGRPLLGEKLAAVTACSEAGLGVVLVPTIIPGVNDNELGALIHFAAKHTPTVRGVHFQPISYFGRYPASPENARRITLPEIMRGLETQTGGQIRVDHFRPPGCEHERCSFHGNFFVKADYTLRPLGASARPCCASETACSPDGAQAAMDVVARQWSAPESKDNAPLPTETKQGSLDAFLQQARQTLAVTGMAFQDAWTLDLERLKGCCIHVAAPNGRLVPFCAWNLTSRHGFAPHREEKWPC